MSSNKILFTLLCLGEEYAVYCNNFINNLLDVTPYNIRVTTNVPEKFTQSERLLVRDVDCSSYKLSIRNQFNYNLKFLAFENIDPCYEYVFYFDCDQRVDHFKYNEIENILDALNNDGKDYFGTRTNSVLKGSLERFKRGENELFTHKILNYQLDKKDPPASWLEACMISEHFFILKNEQPKIITFFETWKALNTHTESLAEDVCQGTWGDGFEIGVSAAVAGYTAYEFNSYHQYDVLGIVFNGYKYSNT